MATRVTVDHVIRGLSFTLWNPMLVTLVPLSMWLSTSISVQSVQFRLVLGYCCSVWILHGLLLLDGRFRRGRNHAHDTVTRVWRDQVIVITGGAGGLGHSLASILAMNHATVVVLDIAAPQDRIPGVEYHETDVSSDLAVSTVSRLIGQRYGKVSVLISNAGIMKRGKISDLEVLDLVQTIAVNLTSHFILAKHFLPLMLQKDQQGVSLGNVVQQAGGGGGGGGGRGGEGQWVTIASTLGYIGTHSLGPYCASKAGTLSFHESLTAEYPSLITTLILPGQLDTDLFRDIINPAPFLAPVLKTFELAQSIVGIIQTRTPGEFALPFYARFMGILRLLPSGLQKLSRQVAGLDRAAQIPT